MPQGPALAVLDLENVWSFTRGGVRRFSGPHRCVRRPQRNWYQLGTRCRRARAARRARDDCRRFQSRRARLHAIARPGGVERTEGREEMSARRTPEWASRPPGRQVPLLLGKNLHSPQTPWGEGGHRPPSPHRVWGETGQPSISTDFLWHKCGARKSTSSPSAKKKSSLQKHSPSTPKKG